MIELLLVAILVVLLFGAGAIKSGIAAAFGALFTFGFGGLLLAGAIWLFGWQLLLLPVILVAGVAFCLLCEYLYRLARIYYW